MNNAESQFIKMTQTPVSKLIITLGIPTTISMLITNIYNMADTYFVSGINESAGGATGIVFSIMAILQAFGFMFGHGAGSHVSRLLGAKNSPKAGNYATTSLVLSLCCGMIIMIAGLSFLEPLLLSLGSTKTILPYAKDYAKMIFAAAPAMTASCVFNNVLRYEGKATFAMVGLTSGGILNILLDYIFIKNLGLETFGAGLATAISQYVSLIILATPFFIGKTQSKIRFSKGFISPRIVWDIISTGLPSLVRQGLSSISVALLNTQARIYGDVAIAAMSYVSKTVQFVFCVGLGIGQGFQPVSAFNYGAGKYSRVKKGSYFTLFFGTVLLGFLAALCYAFAPFIISLFNSKGSATVAQIGVQTLKFNCLALYLQPMSVVANMMFQSIGKREPALILSSLQNGLVYIPMVLVLPRFFGLVGLELVQPVSSALSAIICLPCLVLFLNKLPADREEEKS